MPVSAKKKIDPKKIKEERTYYCVHCEGTVCTRCPATKKRKAKHELSTIQNQNVERL
jgi:hypothetical protein